MIQGHGGNIYEIAKALGCSPREILDMSSNVSPLGMPAGLKAILKEKWEEVVSLPEVDSQSLRTEFAASVDLSPNQVLVGNGTTEFIYNIPLALRVKKALIVGPTYSDYADACHAHGVESTFFLAREEAGFRPSLDKISSMLARVDTVFICNPNNPTGVLTPSGNLATFIEAHPNVRFIIDESYLPFADDAEAESLIPKRLSNVLVLYSMSKIFRIPGLRIGFLIGNPDLIRRQDRYSLPWKRPGGFPV